MAGFFKWVDGVRSDIKFRGTVHGRGTTHAAQAIPVALPCCSPVINHASLPGARPAT